MSGSKVSITITAIDQASARLEAINKKMAAMTAPVRRLSQSLSRFSDASGITKLSKGFGDLARSGLDTFRNLARVVEPLGAIIGAASVAGMIRLTTAWANWASQIGFTAQNLGISASSLQSFQGAARLAGSSSEALTSGLQTLGQNMWNATGGRAPEVVAAFRYLHLGFQNLNGSAKSVTQMLPQIADKIKGIRNPFAQAAVATALFGGAGEQLLPFLRQGSAGIARYTQLMQQYGVINQDGVAAANNLRISQIGLELAVEGLGNTVAQRLAPILSPLLDQMAVWVARNREWIATGIGQAVQQFAQWVQSVNWSAVGASIAAIGANISSVVQYLGGWGSAARDLMIFMAGKWLIGMMAPLVTITAAIVRIIGLWASVGSAASAAGAAEAAAAAASGAGGASAAAAGAGGASAAFSGFMARFFGPLGFLGWGAAASLSGDTASNQPAQSAASAQASAEGSQFWSKYILQHPEAAPTGSGLDVMRQGMAYFMSQGWSKMHAAAIMGNVGRESSYNPLAINTAGGVLHRGLFQWDPSRWAQLTKLYGPEPSVMDQLKFAQHELVTTESGAGQALHASKDLFSGTLSFNDKYERSGDDFNGLGSRIGFANDAFNDDPTVKIEVIHNNPPPGTKLKATSNKPAARVSSVKVVKGMPGGST